MIQIHLKKSKCDQFGMGADVIVGKTGNALCPVAAILPAEGLHWGPSSWTQTAVSSQSPGSCPNCVRCWAALASHNTSMLGTALELAQPPQQPLQVWRTRRSRYTGPLAQCRIPSVRQDAS